MLPRCLILLAIAAFSFAAEEKPGVEEVRERFLLCATRAVASFQAADAIEDSLNERGALLSGDLRGLRMSIERALDRTEQSLQGGDAAGATPTLDRAEELTRRYSRKLGVR